MTLRDKYPHAYEDEQGTVWVSRQCAKDADWTFDKGDAFLEDVLGWSWEDAEENFKFSTEKKRKEDFWRRHPVLSDVLRFITCWTRAIWLFSRVVWREWYGTRLSWSTAWKLSSDIWLR